LIVVGRIIRSDLGAGAGLMTSRFLFGAAGIVLLATAGAANAADALPTVITTTPAAPVAAGSNVALRIDTYLDMWLEFGYPPPEFGAEVDFVVDFQRPTGWSFELLGGGGFDFGLPLYGGTGITARAYQSFSRATIGIYGYVNTSIPFGNFGGGLGWDLEVQAGKVTIHNDNWLDIWSGGIGLNNSTELEFTVSDRVTVIGGVFVGYDFPGFYMDLSGRAKLDLGDFTPYVFAWWSPTTTNFGGGIGVDVEHQIGAGPLSLVGNAELYAYPGGRNFSMRIGVRYSRGDVNTPWWWDWP
jgi:hypothetical protein